MRKFIFIVLILIYTITNIQSQSQSRWSFDLNFGTVYNVPMPLVIKQNGYPDIKLNAKFSTDAFTPPVYWDWRFSRWQNGKSWEFEAIHHKLYLNNTTSEVKKFNISHGFNIITINRGFDKKTFQYRIGAGIVLTHPESIVRGKEFGDSADYYDVLYFVSGPVINFAICKPIHLTNRFYINAEAKTSLAYANVKVEDGHANVYSFALHLVLGLGFDFVKPHEE